MNKKDIMLNPPHAVKISPNFPKEIKTLKQMNKYLWKNFHLDIGIDEKDEDSYERVFYNIDLRSYVGDVWNLNEFPKLQIVFYPKYYIGKTPDDHWSKMWRALIRNSTILNKIEE